MQPETPTSKPRRGRHFGRWILLGILATFGWYGWKAYDFRQAVHEAEAIHWLVTFNDPIAEITRDWRAAFRIKTWGSKECSLGVSTLWRLSEHSTLAKRLNPSTVMVEHTVFVNDLAGLEVFSHLSGLHLADCSHLTNIDALKKIKGLKELSIQGARRLTNIDALKELKTLQSLHLYGCPGLANVDALRELKSLETLDLKGCTSLKNVDGLLGLAQLKNLDLSGCTALPKDAVDAVKAALPNTQVIAPNGK